MSSYFSKVIKTGEGQREFNFRLSSPRDENRYQVDVPDNSGNRVVFYMYKDENGNWNTGAETLPPWIQSATAPLADAIEENRQHEISRKK